MNLADLECYNPITIQCHDNPDADTLASGFALYEYFKSKGKNVRLIYSGRYRISKSNVKLMVEKLGIPVQHVVRSNAPIKGLLIMVDCQYSGGNATRFEADKVAVIDHHQPESEEGELCEIHSDLASCSTLCWKMLQEAGYNVNTNINVATALYYGLFMDTNSMAELYNPLDLDMRDALIFDKHLINLFRNSNISRGELETAGVALIRNIYNDKHRFGIVKAGACDPNLLGLISDFLLQVDGVDTCVVYSEQEDGYKVSVRSCVKEVKANELAIYLCQDIGTAGGHNEKAGGFISKKLYTKRYPSLHSESYFGDMINKYFEETEIIYSCDYELNTEGLELYQRKKAPVAFVKAVEIFPTGTPIVVRTLEGDTEMVVTDDLVIMIGIRGEIYPMRESVFKESYREVAGEYSITDVIIKPTYLPKLTNRNTGVAIDITERAHPCMAIRNVRIYVKPINHYVKIFTDKEDDIYMLGKPGDYLTMREHERHMIYVIDKESLDLAYDKVEQ